MFKTLLLAFALCLLLSAPGLARGSFVYVSNYGDGTISQFRANPNGTLTPLNPPSVKAYPRCHSIVADPEGKSIYALSALEFSRRNCRLSQFHVRPDGTLIPLQPSTVLVPYNGEGGGPFMALIEPSGRFLYVLDRNGPMAQFRRRPDGSLQLLHPGSNPGVNAVGPDASAVFSKRSHLLFFTSNLGVREYVMGRFAAYRFGREGALTLFPRSQRGYNSVGSENPAGPPVSLALTPSGDSLYMSQDHRAGHQSLPYMPSVSQYRVRSDGTLSPCRPEFVPSGGNGPMMVDPQGRRLFVVFTKNVIKRDAPQAADLYLERYHISKSGNLSRPSSLLLASAVLLPDPEPLPAALDASGRVLYLLCGDGVHPFHFRVDGSTTPLSVTPIRAGREPLGMVYVQR
jgi:DNA-binding beta-propeller fold protein YncE